MFSRLALCVGHERRDEERAVPEKPYKKMPGMDMRALPLLLSSPVGTGGSSGCVGHIGRGGAVGYLEWDVLRGVQRLAGGIC